MQIDQISVKLCKMISILQKIFQNPTYGLLKIPLFGNYLKWLQKDTFDSEVDQYPKLSSKFETSPQVAISPGISLELHC